VYKTSDASISHRPVSAYVAIAGQISKLVRYPPSMARR
jgi:hypothetical protein